MNPNILRRRMAATASLAAVSLFMGACGSTGEVAAPTPVSTASTPGASTPASSAPAAEGSKPAEGGNPADSGKPADGKKGGVGAAETCRVINKAKVDLGTRLAVKPGADSNAINQKAFETFAEKLRAAGAAAADPALAKALQEVGGLAAKLATQPDPFSGKGMAAFEKAGGKLDVLCKGKA